LLQFGGCLLQIFRRLRQLILARIEFAVPIITFGDKRINLWLDLDEVQDRDGECGDYCEN